MDVGSIKLMRYSLYSIIFSFTEWLQIFWAPLHINLQESHLCRNQKWSQLEENQPQGKIFDTIQKNVHEISIMTKCAFRFFWKLIWQVTIVKSVIYDELIKMRQNNIEKKIVFAPPLIKF